MREKVNNTFDLGRMSPKSLDQATRILVAWQLQEWKALQDEEWAALKKPRNIKPERWTKRLVRHHWARVFLEAGRGWHRRDGSAFEAAADMFGGALGRSRTFRGDFQDHEDTLEPGERYRNRHQ